MAAYGHKSECKSEVEVVEKATFDRHAHGNITRAGKMSGVASQKMLRTNADGLIVADNTIDADININGTVKAKKIVGAVYA